MQVQPADRAKAVILVVAIVAVMGFVLKTALFRPKSPGGSPPPAAATTPAPAPGTGPVAMNDPALGGPGTPNVSVVQGTPPPTGQAPGVNPFRATVAQKKPGGGGQSGKGTGKPPPGLDGNLKPVQPGQAIIQEAEFRLAGVLIDSPSVAIVTRGGSTTQYLKVGSPAAYGYKVAEIRPRGIRVSQKNSSKWVLVGERLEPPAAVVPMVPPPSYPEGASGASIGAGITPGWEITRLPNVQISTDGASRMGARSEAVADGWHSSLNSAKAEAKSTGRKIFVDFYATWCGPCKQLDEEVLTTPKFRKYSGKLVFLRIDVDAQPNVAQAYGIRAMPTQMILRADGSVLRSKVGYGGPTSFYAFLENALSGG